MNNKTTVPPHIAQAFDFLMDDHEELTNFLFGAVGIETTLDELAQHARSNEQSFTAEHVVWAKRFAEAMRNELIEFEESYPKKWWRGEKADIQNARIELVDIFHFLLSAVRATGMSGQQFITLYYKKRHLNYRRQTEGFLPDDNKGLVV